MAPRVKTRGPPTSDGTYETSQTRAVYDHNLMIYGRLRLSYDDRNVGPGIQLFLGVRRISWTSSFYPHFISILRKVVHSSDQNKWLTLLFQLYDSTSFDRSHIHTKRAPLITRSLLKISAV